MTCVRTNMISCLQVKDAEVYIYIEQANPSISVARSDGLELGDSIFLACPET